MLSRDEVLKIVDDNRIFTVRFLRKDNSERVLTGRLGVRKGVKGVGKRFKDEDHNLITVYEMNGNGFRSFNVDRVLEIKAHGEVIKNVS